MALVVVSIFSPLFAMTASRDPINMAIRSLGVAAAVAAANMSGCTVGNVDMAPFEMLYGRGQSLIITKSFKPSCFKTRDSASYLLSFATSRLTKLERSVRETMNEHVDPTIVAEATIGQLSWCQLPIVRCCTRHELCNSLPPWKSVDEASESQAGGIAYYWGKRGGEGHRPQNEPPSSQIFPSLSHWFQPCKYFFAEDKE